MYNWYNLNLSIVYCLCSTYVSVVRFHLHSSKRFIILLRLIHCINSYVSSSPHVWLLIWMSPVVSSCILTNLILSSISTRQKIIFLVYWCPRHSLRIFLLKWTIILWSSLCYCDESRDESRTPHEYMERVLEARWRAWLWRSAHQAVLYECNQDRTKKW